MLKKQYTCVYCVSGLRNGRFGVREIIFSTLMSVNLLYLVLKKVSIIYGVGIDVVLIYVFLMKFCFIELRRVMQIIENYVYDASMSLSIKKVTRRKIICTLRKHLISRNLQLFSIISPK